MSSTNSVGGSGNASLYQLLLQELQATSTVSVSISTQSSLSASLMAIDQVIFSSSSVSSSSSLAAEASADPLQQYLSQAYKAS